MQFLPYGSLG